MCEESPGDKPDSRELRPNLSGRRVQTADVDKFALVSFESSRFQPLGTGTLGSIRSASGSRRPPRTSCVRPRGLLAGVAAGSELRRRMVLPLWVTSRTDGPHLAGQTPSYPAAAGSRRDWRTGRREVPPNLLEWLHTYAEAMDRLPTVPKGWAGPEADAPALPDC
jgi:hypothetical protein